MFDIKGGVFGFQYITVIIVSGHPAGSGWCGQLIMMR
jgi:hypothetical protein